MNAIWNESFKLSFELSYQNLVRKARMIKTKNWLSNSWEKKLQEQKRDRARKDETSKNEQDIRNKEDVIPGVLNDGKAEESGEVRYEVQQRVELNEDIRDIW